MKSELAMESELLEQEADLDVPSLIRSRYVALVGRPASMSREEFIDLLEANGARYALNIGRGVSVVVVGQRDWPVTQEGLLPQGLRDARKLICHQHSSMRVLSEEQFLSALGLEAYRQNVGRLYTLSTLTEVLNVSREKVRAWVAAGLIRPAKVEYGVWYFDLRQASAAKTLRELVQRGVPLRRLRLSLEQLRRWVPEAKEPLEQLAVLEGKADLLVRLEEGELVEPDGQLHLDFVGDPAAGALKIMPGPRTAEDWLIQGKEQERQGYLAEATESYRQALLLGGPNAHTCYRLANVLAAQGKRAQAMERYMQALELEPGFAQAWNNLGLVLAEMQRPDDACSALRKALAADPNDPRAHYNLADLLDELGRTSEAADHWKAYLRQDATSRWAEHARQRLAVS